MRKAFRLPLSLAAVMLSYVAVKQAPAVQAMTPECFNNQRCSHSGPNGSSCYRSAGTDGYFCIWFPANNSCGSSTGKCPIVPM